MPIDYHDCVDVPELVDSFIIFSFFKKNPKTNKSSIDLHCYDGPGIFQSISNPETENKKTHQN